MYARVDEYAYVLMSMYKHIYTVDDYVYVLMSMCTSICLGICICVYKHVDVLMNTCILVHVLINLDLLVI